MNVRKASKIHGLITNTKLVATVNNACRSIVTTEESASTKMDKKYACK